MLCTLNISRINFAVVSLILRCPFCSSGDRFVLLPQSIHMHGIVYMLKLMQAIQIKSIQNWQISHGYIFRTLGHLPIKLRSFTNFKMRFPAVLKDLVLLD